MTEYGWSLLLTMGLGFLPWSYLFERGRDWQKGPYAPLIIASLFVVLSTYLYADMLLRFGPEGRGAGMIAFLTVSIQVGSIAVGGLLWSVLGQRSARRFLDAPFILLTLSLAAALLTLFFSLNFTPLI